MALQPGTRIGPYQVVAALGAGGMGEVYRARDARLQRDVAIKVLPDRIAHDADALNRFEREARALGALSHPNIVAVYDVGKVDDTTYVVMELVEGKTLRSVLAEGRLPVRKAVGYAVQIASGLAAAHDKDVIHRDLKPENVLVTADSRVKILDFGLARVTPQLAEAGTTAATAARSTEEGVVLGTVGYMSPEQVRGERADARSDIFSFGALLYEMLGGVQAFDGGSAVETMNAVLKEDPRPLEELVPALPAGFDAIVRHCLEKQRADRFQSARDLAFDLSTLATVSSGSERSLPRTRADRWRRRLQVAAFVVALLLAVAAGALLGRRAAQRPMPTFKTMTFRRGMVHSGRFAPDGRSIVYGAAWQGEPLQLYASRLESPESSSIAVGPADVMSVAPNGDMAILKGSHYVGGFGFKGTLATVPMSGGAPRDLLADVEFADWSPDGQSLAVVHTVDGLSTLEFPVGHVLYRTPGWLTHPKVSPDGSHVAFIEHAAPVDDGGNIVTVTRDGRADVLSRGWLTAMGLAWSPRGDEVWFTATRFGNERVLNAVSLAGQERALAGTGADLTLLDVSRDGRVLISQDSGRNRLFGVAPDNARERELSWFDWSVARAISPDGRLVLFDETGSGAGASPIVYIRPTDGSPAVKLGAGVGCDFSPDGASVLSVTGGQHRFFILPIGAGQSRPVDSRGIDPTTAAWFADGTRLLVLGHEANKGTQLFVLPFGGGPARPISPQGVEGPMLLAPDGRLVAITGLDGRVWVYETTGGAGRPMTGLEPDERPLFWSADSSAIYVRRRGVIPARIYRVDLDSGRRTLWKEIAPADASGVIDVIALRASRDLRAYVYSVYSVLSDLYVLDGVR